jgi:hypothetical protein
MGGAIDQGFGNHQDGAIQKRLRLCPKPHVHWNEPGQGREMR